MQVARRSDMDMNGHINNVTYLAWALEGVPQEVYDGKHLYEVRIKGSGFDFFLAEATCAYLRFGVRFPHGTGHPPIGVWGLVPSWPRLPVRG